MMCRINCKKELVGDSVWVGCSGGVDSIAVAHYVIKKLKRDVQLFHFNHGLRSQNDEMEASVVEFSRVMDVPLIIDRAPSDLEDTSEAYLRDLRISSMKRHVGEGTIVFGHHLDDCVESYLMNCFNGVGEYDPIPPSTVFYTDEVLATRTHVVRPFLLTPKRALEKYVDVYNLCGFIIEDETNTDTKYRRNKVRHVTRPVIEEDYPGISKVVFKKVEDSYLKYLYDQKMTDPSGYVWEGK